MKRTPFSPSQRVRNAAICWAPSKFAGPAALVLTLSMAVHAQAETIVRELASDFSWGFKSALKQPLGAYMDGLNVYQVTKPLSPEANAGNPDYLFWVDENTGDSGVSELPTQTFIDNGVNPGGMVEFGDDGTLWYAYGGRAPEISIDLFSSQQPFDTTAFDRRVEDVDPALNSSTPLVHAHDSKVMLFHRHLGSTRPQTAVRFRRYAEDDLSAPELELEIARAEEHPDLGRVAIEQLWSRHDPRHDLTMLSWSFYDANPQPNRVMGSYPLVYTDDDGDTWRRADGVAIDEYPIQYSDIDDVLVPVDHLSEGRHMGWLPQELGISPNGKFWMSMPYDRSGGELEFWFFDDGQWQERTLAADIGGRKSHATGVTQDYIVSVFAESDSPSQLHARVSHDDGDTWSDSILLDTLDPEMTISWITFVQPDDAYEDNSARFFYGYAENDDGASLSFQNNVRWVNFDVAEAPGDFDADGTIDGADMLAWQRGESPDPFSEADLAFWEANFGVSIPAVASTSSTVVPEPAGACLALLGAMAALLLRSRR